MGLETATLLYIALGTAAVGTAASIHQGRQARNDQRRANEVASRRRAIESRRATIANIEDARQAIGSIQNTAALTGGQGGSGAQGAVSSLVTQFGNNATFNQQLLTFAQRQESLMQNAADHIANANGFARIAQLAVG